MKLEISLYKFDAKSDYLPYYTKHYIKPKNEKNLLDILQTIHKESPFGFEKNKNSAVVVNGLYTTLDLTLEQIKQDFGSHLQIEPLSTVRAYKDLLINDDVFNEKLSLLTQPLSDEDKALYESYKLYYYASNSLNFNKNYMGDAFILLAHNLLQKGFEQKEIYALLSDEKTGISFHTNLGNRIYNFDTTIEETIQQLQQKLNAVKPLDEQNFKPNSTKTIDFDKACGTSIVKHSFKDFNIAYFTGLQGCEKTQTLIDTLEAKKILLPSLSNDLAMNTFHINPNFSYALTAQVMLDAFDNNADFIVVDNIQAFYLLDFNRKELEKVSGREILLPVIHSNELSKLVCGLHDEAKKTLVQHAVNPDLV